LVAPDAAILPDGSPEQSLATEAKLAESLRGCGHLGFGNLVGLPRWPSPS